MIARVAVFSPIGKPLDYEVPVALRQSMSVGARVWVPLGRRSIEGIVLALDPPESASPGKNEFDRDRLKPIHQMVEAPPIRADLVELGSWMIDYYMASPGEVMRLFVPAGGRAKGRRRIGLTERGQALADKIGGALEPVELAELSRAAKQLLTSLRDGVKELDPSAEERELSDLVEVEDEVKLARPKMVACYRIVRQPAPGELDRAPKRGEIFQRVAMAGELFSTDLKGASAHLKALVAAGLLSEQRREVTRDPFAQTPLEASPVLQLTIAQAAALERIEPAIAARTYAPFLLHGVTGSGKTEIYLRAIATALEMGRTALVLVPEISLTPQLASRFRARFGGDVAVLHSGLGDAERQDAFRRIENKQVSIALGARSAVFAPLENLGVVVVDEEHDSSFKQEDGMRYNGRDVALRRARGAGAVAILGSATPAIETFVAAREGRLQLLELPNRATVRPLPPIEIVDLKIHRPNGFFSGLLERALGETFLRGEQSILFLNRRGFSTFIMCKGCGQAVRCRDCSVTLTYHRSSDRVHCHYCGFTQVAPKVCAICGARSIEHLGFGTEQVEAVVKELLPAARVARLDRDSAQGGGLLRVLDGLRAHEIDILVGTQMVTKGHDFPGVTLVGVVLADLGMGLPDFRASERTFQLLEQVAGRAGRGERPGRVLVQTYNPTHPAVACAKDHDYVRFAELELESRRELGYPPHSRMACLRIDGADPLEVRQLAEALSRLARQAAESAPAEESIEVVGPSEAPLSRLKGRSRWQLFFRAKSARSVRALVRAALPAQGRSFGTALRVTVDIDPISML